MQSRKIGVYLIAFGSRNGIYGISASLTPP
jgi:hypothetical protein